MPNSEKIMDVKQLAQELHASKVINLDTKLGDLLTSAQGIGAIDPNGEVTSELVVWDGYLLIHKGIAADLKSLDAIRNRVRSEGGVK